MSKTDWIDQLVTDIELRDFPHTGLERRVERARELFDEISTDLEAVVRHLGSRLAIDVPVVVRRETGALVVEDRQGEREVEVALDADKGAVHVAAREDGQEQSRRTLYAFGPDLLVHVDGEPTERASVAETLFKPIFRRWFGLRE